MLSKKIIILIIIWTVYVFMDYFIFPYYVQPFYWLVVAVTLLILVARQMIKLIRQRKKMENKRLVTFSTILILFLLTFYNFNKIPKYAIEKIDWNIFYKKRIKIVNDVLVQKLKPNSKLNNGICELPFKFPIISNGGNEIVVYENGNRKTVKFWISRGFFDSPQMYFVYTNDNDEIKYYKKLVEVEPEYNWKLEENWYRIMEK